MRIQWSNSAQYAKYLRQLYIVNKYMSEDFMCLGATEMIREYYYYKFGINLNLSKDLLIDECEYLKKHINELQDIYAIKYINGENVYEYTDEEYRDKLIYDEYIRVLDLVIEHIKKDIEG